MNKSGKRADYRTCNTRIVMETCDLFECYGAVHVVLVDYYSDFFEVDRLSDKRPNEVVRKLKALFRYT